MNPKSEPEAGAISISWAHILRALGWLIPVLLAVTMLYLRSEFVTRQQVVETFQPVATLPSRVERLEDFHTQHQRLDAEASRTASVIQQDIAGLKAQVTGLKEQSTKDTDRILQRLDMMQK